MAVFKCKMCGGELEIQEDLSVCECEYCGTTQTIPSLDNEKKMTLFNRANKLRFNNEFDKASAVYENIVAEFPEEAEGYWGLVLCKYGIEYVDDKKTAKKIPTCHRTVPSPVTKDDDFKKAIECADVVAQKVYKEEAKVIDKLQKQILKIVESEEPYDVFICYKETDSKGKRTDDSTIAQDIYTELVKADYKVFFARVTLRDKAGSDYEPYIYSALSSAKVMLAIGTKEEYYDAVWVKNEWSRYLSMMSDDKSKHLIPCYKDIDAYDLPDDFKNLQALNMGDVTFYKDLMSAIEKFVPKKKEVVKETESSAVSAGNSQIAPLIKRAYMFASSGDFENANEYAERVLDIDPEYVDAYIVKLLVECHYPRLDWFNVGTRDFSESRNYRYICTYGDSEVKSKFEGYLNGAKARKIENDYKEVVAEMKSVKTSKDLISVSKKFAKFGDYKKAKEYSEICKEKAKEVVYNNLVVQMETDNETKLQKIANEFESLNDYKDSKQKAQICYEKIANVFRVKTKQQELSNKTKKKNNELSNKKETYNNLNEQYLSEKAVVDSLDTVKNLCQKYRTLSILFYSLLVLSIVSFFAISYSSLFAFVNLLGLLSLVLVQSKKIANRKELAMAVLQVEKKDFFKKIGLKMIIPFSGFNFRRDVVKKAKELVENADEIIKQNQQRLDELKQRETEMTRIESEIQDLKNQYNDIK